ncbi:hypothetical protein QU38_01785 [Staphylococcus aureus]|uniref:Uncharacterized protein n=1 Tax=Staphylococcus aureus TaxID=1280 RepID=A0AA40JQ74_STAAU|nr:hypothetical protein QU38_01785 [Staphylococcus aureus]
MREEPGQLLVEGEVHADDHRGRRLADLVGIGAARQRREPFPGLRRGQPHEARGLVVGRGGPHLEQAVDAADIGFGHRRVGIAVIGARGTEDRVQRRVVERLGHVPVLSWAIGLRRPGLR